MFRGCVFGIGVFLSRVFRASQGHASFFFLFLNFKKLDCPPVPTPPPKKGYADDAHDATCAAFGIRNVPNRAKALGEMARVTKPGGVVALLEFSEPSEGALAPLAQLFVAHVVPRLGETAREQRAREREMPKRREPRGKELAR